MKKTKRIVLRHKTADFVRRLIGKIGKKRGVDPFDGNHHLLTGNGYEIEMVPECDDEDQEFFNQFDEFGFLKNGYLK